MSDALIKKIYELQDEIKSLKGCENKLPKCACQPCRVREGVERIRILQDEIKNEILTDQGMSKDALYCKIMNIVTELSQIWVWIS